MVRQKRQGSVRGREVIMPILGLVVIRVSRKEGDIRYALAGEGSDMHWKEPR